MLKILLIFAETNLKPRNIMSTVDFARHKTSYRNLKAFLKAEAIYDLTYFFSAETYKKQLPHLRPDASGRQVRETKYCGGELRCGGIGRNGDKALWGGGRQPA